MEEAVDNHASLAPAAPPTRPGQLIAPKRLSTWPMVIGVISICIGALATLSYGCNSAMTFVVPWFMEWMAGQAGGQGAAAIESQAEAMAGYMGVTALTHAFGMALGILLLAAGISLTRRRPAARPLHLWWAGLKLAHAVGYAVVTYLSTQATMEAVMADMQASGGGAPPPGLVTGIAALGPMLTLVWLFIYPIFLFIWFARRKVRDEVAQWKAQLPEVA